jgi:hypothetical protein
MSSNDDAVVTVLGVIIILLGLVGGLAIVWTCVHFIAKFW